MTQADSPRDEAAIRRSRRRSALLVLGAIAIVVVLLLRWCKPQDPAMFDYFHDKARTLSFDAGRCLAFVRDDVKLLGYRGDARGPLATLWHGAGSPEEKRALAERLLAACGSARKVELDEVASARDRASDGAVGAAPRKLKVTHVLRVGETTKPTVVAEGPVGDFVGDVHTIELLEGARTRIALRGAAGRASGRPWVEISSQGADAEEVVFEVERAPGEPPFSSTRELWAQGNRVGADRPEVGDRHDFVVLPCRVTTYVREKEAFLLEQQGRKEAAEAEPYRELLDFALTSDELLARLEKDHGVTARFDLPRVLISSRMPAPSLPGGTARAFDLRIDRAGFEGEETAAFLASEARSLIECGLEQTFLEKRARLPCTSTADVFARLDEDRPIRPSDRLGAAAAALDWLLTLGAGAKVTFTAGVARGPAPKAFARVEAVREGDGGIRLRSGKLRGDLVERYRSDMQAADAVAPPLRAEGLDAVFTDSSSAALAVETALLFGDQQPPTPSSYALDVAVDRGIEPWVVQHARFALAFGEGDSRTEQRVEVLDCADDLAIRVRVDSGALPVRGTRLIRRKALDEALVHDPWYRGGPTSSDSATSFCLSRKAYAELKAGRPVELSLLGRLAPGEDDRSPRRVERKATLAPLGPGTVRTRVNGREEEVPVLRARLDQEELAFIDDPAFPVGMAQGLVSVETSVRGRLVAEEDGGPIAGARLSVPRPGAEPIGVLTALDGSFRLPPAPPGGYGKVKVEVRRDERSSLAVELDLENPGLATLVVKAPRPPADVAWISSADAARLDALPVSDQVKRFARRDLASGYLVAIPTRMVDDGLDGVIGYFALDRSTGDILGVTEDGLHGSSAWARAAQSALKDVQKLAKKGGPTGEQAGSAPFHAFRGAVVAFWTYSTMRLGGLSHAEAIIATLESMDRWASSLSLTGAAKDALGDALGTKLGDKLAGKLKSAVNKGLVKTDDDAASAAFKIGYMSATLFLAIQLEGSG